MQDSTSTGFVCRLPLVKRRPIQRVKASAVLAACRLPCNLGSCSLDEGAAETDGSLDEGAAGIDGNLYKGAAGTDGRRPALQNNDQNIFKSQSPKNPGNPAPLKNLTCFLRILGTCSVCYACLLGTLPIDCMSAAG